MFLIAGIKKRLEGKKRKSGNLCCVPFAASVILKLSIRMRGRTRRTSSFWLRLNEARSVQERQAQSHVTWSPLTYLCSSETISQLTWHVTLIFRPVTLALKMSSSSPHLTRTSVPAGISSFALSWLCKNYHDKTIASVERRNVHGHYPQTLSVPRSELWVLRNRLCPRTNMGRYFPPTGGYIVIITLQIFWKLRNITISYSSGLAGGHSVTCRV